ncbi:hypothetical protein [Moritella sp. 28]|uniref:alginate O-acetyltransferase AlgX-related protein n=1 Tax=Moritella sp. 28 TaxID=2746232 RepID=UPI001BA78783|nr:hypothetical protein [Moritella sp. 28]QUM86295.1 hypothetical protein HWV02_18185 [Moritella sp. 28]
MNKLIIFLVSFSFAFFPIPIFGIYAQHKIFSYSIFNYNYSLYRLGISSDKNKALVGSDGWLFLGNNYVSVMTKSKTNYKIPDDEVNSNEQFIKKLKDISEEANSKFKFIALPNKHSIYGEHLGLNSNVGEYSYYSHNANPVRSNMVSYLRGMKTKTSNDLYFKTDTHWNDLGAFYGYQYLMKYTFNDNFNRIPSSLKFHEIKYKSGDLARLLNVEDLIPGKNITVLAPTTDKVIRTNLITNVVSNVGIQGDINNFAIKQPINIVNNNALNNISILWLHDSFGRAMSPYMHSTFRNVTHQHYTDAFENMSNLKKLIQNVKPDIILLSVVERNSLSFGKYLPKN